MMRKAGGILGAMACLMVAAPAHGQWAIFQDADDPGRTCGLVNAANVQLVVIDQTNELAIVSGNCRILANTRVDDVGNVLVDDQPFGTLEFAEDGDGARALVWLGAAGSLISFDLATAEPQVSGLFPATLTGSSCEAAAFWNSAGCGDNGAPSGPTSGDGDGNGDAGTIGSADDTTTTVDPGTGINLAPLIGSLCGLGTGAPATMGLLLLGMFSLRLARR